jgi:hypothetical protein
MASEEFFRETREQRPLSANEKQTVIDAVAKIIGEEHDVYLQHFREQARTSDNLTKGTNGAN